MKTSEVFGPDRGAGARHPNVGRLWLHRPTGTAGLSGVQAHHDGGPITGWGERLLDPLTPVPLPDGSPEDAGRTEEQLRTAAAERGWRPVTRAQAAALLRAEGYRLRTERSFGHVLYADQADAVSWHDHPSTRHDRECFAARDGLEQGTPTPAAAAPSRLALATLLGEDGRVLLAPLTARRDGSLYLHTGTVLDPHSPPLQPSPADAQGALAEAGWFPVPHQLVVGMLGFSGVEDEALALLHVDQPCEGIWHATVGAHYLSAVVAYRGERRPIPAQRPDPRLEGGYLSDDLLERIGVERDAAFDEPFEDETLRWLAETVNGAWRIPLHPYGQWDDPAEHFAQPFAPLGVRDVKMIAHVLTDDPSLTLTWTAQDGTVRAHTDIHPEDLLGEQSPEGYLRGYALARHAIAAAYTVIEQRTAANLATGRRAPTPKVNKKAYIYYVAPFATPTPKPHRAAAARHRRLPQRAAADRPPRRSTMPEHATPPANPKHVLLWQAEHPYGFAPADPDPGRGTVADEEYDDWAQFAEQEDAADPDYDLLVRWDWENYAGYAEPGEYAPDKLRLAFVQQRRGRLRTVAVVIRHEDEPAVRAWLQKRCDHLAAVWAPITPTQVRAAMGFAAEPPQDARVK